MEPENIIHRKRMLIMHTCDIFRNSLTFRTSVALSVPEMNPPSDFFRKFNLNDRGCGSEGKKPNISPQFQIIQEEMYTPACRALYNRIFNRLFTSFPYNPAIRNYEKSLLFMYFILNFLLGYTHHIYFLVLRFISFLD